MKNLFLTIILFALTEIALGQNVFKTPSGKAYHLATCRMVKNVSQEITVEQAKKTGLQPCKICQPANIYGTGMAAPHKAKGEAPATVQCKGMTKAGNRCRHKTSIANGFCYQHQP